ncbi:MAG TPA: class I tRNA ligase family protein [Solirubrobacterales bacterium]|nr:class I tRNA ligase family protein [Solirubrobacterales bacterium]
MERMYQPRRVEAARRAEWLADGAFETALPRDGQEPVYVKPSSPFTTGGLHMGHVRSYSIADTYARFRRQQGDAVLFGLGFDAFGLPSELGAIEKGKTPAAWVRDCGERMLAQMQRLGISIDYQRVFYTSDLEIYRWTQWLFLELLEAGLIYRATATQDWCDSCETTLAALQVEEGRCWRCRTETRLRTLPHWFFRVSAYTEENDSRLADLSDWDEVSHATQRHLLGRSDGVEVDLESREGRRLTVFSPHAEALREATFVLISQLHPEVDRWITSPAAREEVAGLRSGGWARSARDATRVPVIDTGTRLSGPLGTELSLYVSPIVQARFGPTAVFGIPSVDEADALLAPRVSARELQTGAATAPLASPARAAVRFRAGDFSISRQRGWGTPTPIVVCEDCGFVPVPREDLPVVLPDDLGPSNGSNALAGHEGFTAVPCPHCGRLAKRETDTLDCHFDALWKWIPPCVPPEDRTRSMFDHPDLRKWLPAERLVGGADVGNSIFDQRVLTKALRDIGPLSFLEDGEPFTGALVHEMVLRDGRKMSKHLGNTVDPSELIERHGADVVRLAVLYAAAPAKSVNWSEGVLRFAERFLASLWSYIHDSIASAESAARDEEAEADTEFIRERLDKWCANGSKRVTAAYEAVQIHKAVRESHRMFERIKDFEKRILTRRGELSRADAEARLEALAILIRLLVPVAPHFGETLLSELEPYARVAEVT